MNFAATFKNHIESKNINIPELAKEIGISPQYMYDLLKNERRWNEDIINKVCAALKLDIQIKEVQ